MLKVVMPALAVGEPALWVALAADLAHMKYSVSGVRPVKVRLVCQPVVGVVVLL